MWIDTLATDTLEKDTLGIGMWTDTPEKDTPGIGTWTDIPVIDIPATDIEAEAAETATNHIQVTVEAAETAEEVSHLLLLVFISKAIAHCRPTATLRTETDGGDSPLSSLIGCERCGVCGVCGVCEGCGVSCFVNVTIIMPSISIDSRNNNKVGSL
ncbi:hypothetical protein BDF14DRAFT_1333576 [Spinellus fusiger]|nr:hypothetical protein BDF14DRAFT_1333576 [Spinellus fusiger]